MINPSPLKEKYYRSSVQAMKSVGSKEENRYNAMLDSIALEYLLKLGGEQNSQLHQQLLKLTRDVWAYSRIEKEEDSKGKE